MAYKVLLADDSVPAQNMGKKILIEAGYDVLTVSNGLEALRKIADVMPDIAILDIFMPGYTGLEICERLRAKPATAELPVILTVGKLEPYRPEDGEHVGSNAVIVKPFAAAELIAAVRSLIGVRRAEVVFSAENPPPANVADPVEADLAASDEKPLSERLAEMPVEGTDEPLFASAPTATVAESLHAEEPGPESLVFNPDAGRTPFSASVVEAPPAELEAPAGSGPSAVTEFHLELEAPAHDLAEPFPAGEIVESWPIEPEAAAPIITQDAKQDDAATVAQMPNPEPAAIAAEAAVTEEPAEYVGTAVSGEAVDAAVPPVEPDSSLREEPVLEPLAEARDKVADSDGMASEIDAGGFPELVLLEDVVDGEEFMTAMDEPLTREQEARRQAFEDLFNSDVPFPLEKSSTLIPEPETVGSASLTESSEQELGEIVLEPEIAGNDFLDEPVAPAPGREAMAEFDPAPAAEPVFEGELLLEDNPAASAPSLEIEQPSVEDVSSVLGDSYTVRPDVISHPMPQFHAEVAANEPEIPAVAAPVEAAPIQDALPPPVASPERSELVAEVAKVEALLVQMQAVRQVGEAAEHAHTETELQPPDADADMHSVGGAAPAESVPLQAVEEAPIEAAAAPGPVEMELPQAEAAPVQVEPELVSSPLEMTPEEMAHARPEADEEEPAFAPASEDGLNEAERIHKAVERVFDRFRPLLVAAIVRELIRRD